MKLLQRLRCLLGDHADTYRHTTKDGERMFVCSVCGHDVPQIRRSELVTFVSKPAHETMKARPSRPAEIRTFRSKNR